MAGVKRALSSGGTQASSKGKRSKKDKKEPRTENASSEHSAAAPEKRGRPRKGLKHAAASKVKVANDGSASRAVSSMGEVASSSSRGISSSNPAETAAVQRPQQRQASEQSSRTQREDLMLFLDLGNSQTQVAYYWRGKQLLWFDDWAGEAKTTQVPTMVTAYKKPNGEWTRTFGLHARTDSHLIEGAVVFDRLKMNFDPDSKYLDDQKKKEGETGYCDNWNFLLESYLTTVLDGIVDSNHPPKRVYTYMGPPAKWDAAVIAKYTASVVPPRKWAGKFEMIVRVLNEASAAFLGRVNNGLTLKNGRRGIVIDPGHGTTEFTTVRKEPHSHAIEHYTGINHGGLEIDEFAKKKVAEAYPEGSKPSEAALNEWIDLYFQARYKKDILGDQVWFFERKPLPSSTKEAIKEFALQFYKDLAKRVDDYVKQQSERGEVQTIVLTGGGAAATAFQKEMRRYEGNWDFSPQQQNDVIWGLYYHSKKPSHLSYDNWPLTMGIHNDDGSIENPDKLDGKANRAVFFTEKGTKVPETLEPIVWDLTRQTNDTFKFDVSLVITSEDLSDIPYLEDVKYKETTAEGCAELPLEPVVLEIESREATIYVFPIPEGDMLALIIIGRKDGRESPILNRLRLFRKQNFRLEGFEGAEYIRKEVRFATGKEYLEEK